VSMSASNNSSMGEGVMTSACNSGGIGVGEQLLDKDLDLHSLMMGDAEMRVHQAVMGNSSPAWSPSTSCPNTGVGVCIGVGIGQSVLRSPSRRNSMTKGASSPAMSMHHVSADNCSSSGALLVHLHSHMQSPLTKSLSSPVLMPIDNPPQVKPQQQQQEEEQVVGSSGDVWLKSPRMLLAPIVIQVPLTSTNTST
jgi:hypothetical protein